MKSSLLKCVGASLVVIALGFAAAGCDSDSSSTSADLIAAWQLQEFILADGTVTAVDDPEKYTMDFGADGRVSVVTDCNRCNGAYAVDGDSLTLGPLACTIAACLPGSFDGQFQVGLSTVSSYEVADGSLFLRYAGGELRLTPAPALFQ
jgi:heat shock protein HslJ